MLFEPYLHFHNFNYSHGNILKTIKNATDIQVISTFQGHLVRFVYSEVSLPLARESFSEN